MFKKFISSRSGNFAMMASIAVLPLLLGVGMAVDYSRHVSAKRHLQNVADSVSLALATGTDRNLSSMVATAQKFINSNLSNGQIDKINDVTAKDIVVDGENVDVSLAGYVNTHFMGIAGYKVLDVKASSLAVRSPAGNVEVALVLDNTWSMSEADSSGVRKIDALKKSANGLIDSLMAPGASGVKITLVPYADYVNVGIENRNKPWLAIEPEVKAVAPTCTTQETTSTPCITWTSKTCTTTIDGVPETWDCGSCTAYGAPVTTTQQVCTGGISEQTWKGCVGSRTIGKLRLDDTSPLLPYPGYVDRYRPCLNPVIALTADKTKLKTAVNGMIINHGGYKPNTYIPAGLVWGVNMLSPTAPFSEGGTYDPMNQKPRKALVLMTDGENTLTYRPSDGRHIPFSSNKGEAAVEFRKVNNETVEICDYAKSNKIEVFSIAFMVDNADARKILQKCATDSDHYFDATDSERLASAFGKIAESLSLVRLAR